MSYDASLWILGGLFTLFLWSLILNTALGLLWSIYAAALALFKVKREQLTWVQATSTGIQYALMVLILTSLAPDAWEETRTFHLLGVVGIASLMSGAVSQRKPHDTHLPPFHWAEMFVATIYLYLVVEGLGPHIVPALEFLVKRIVGA